MDKKYTIKDIAELSGVSKGTVDRVLHRRGKVSKKARESVEKVLEKIDYEPNPMARNLKINKMYNISVIVPDPKFDRYWSPAVKGIKEAAKEFKAFGVLVKRYYYNPLDSKTFLEKSHEAIQTKPDVLLIAPLFKEEAIKIFTKCQEGNISIALFNNYLDALSKKNFIGQDLFQSGRVAASLIDKIVSNTSKIGIIHIDKESHMQLKEDGFKAYFKEKEPFQKLQTFNLSTFNKNSFINNSKKILSEHKDMAAYFITNSKTYLFSNAIGNLSKEIVLVGYDLLEENIKLLKTGQIDYLIHQKPRQQAYLALEYLAEHFVFGKEIPTHNLLPIDIITSENVQYYI